MEKLESQKAHSIMKARAPKNAEMKNEVAMGNVKTDAIFLFSRSQNNFTLHNTVMKGRRVANELYSSTYWDISHN